MNINYTEIGRRIARRRRDLHLKQSQVCEMCDLSDKYLSGIEQARSIPSIDVLMRICYALDTTPDALLLGTAAPSSDMEQAAIQQRIKALNIRQLRLLSSFLDWLIQESI